MKFDRETCANCRLECPSNGERARCTLHMLCICWNEGLTTSLRRGALNFYSNIARVKQKRRKKHRKKTSHSQNTRKGAKPIQAFAFADGGPRSAVTKTTSNKKKQCLRLGASRRHVFEASAVPGTEPAFGRNTHTHTAVCNYLKREMRQPASGCF